MRHSIKINGSTIPVEMFVTVFDKQTDAIVDDGFDSFNEANISYPTSEYYFRWTAARIIDRHGNLDFPIYASSKYRVLSDLKKSLI